MAIMLRKKMLIVLSLSAPNNTNLTYTYVVTQEDNHS